MNRAVFLDRDGTIIVDTYYLHDPEKLKLLPYSISALKQLQELGFLLIIVSNQSGIGRGYFSEKTMIKVNNKLIDILKKNRIKISGVYYSPFYENSKVKKYRQKKKFRKPGPGMLLKAAKDFNIELSASYMIGDKESDIGAGINSGVKSNILIKGMYPFKNIEYHPDKIVRNIKQAANWITEKEIQSHIIMSREILKKTVTSIKKKKKKIITTNGVFDILHIGHIRYLNECRKYGHVLIVGVNSDDSVKRIKGKDRPIINQFARAEMIASLKPVDYVYIFNEDDPCSFLNLVKTDVHIKAGDYTIDQIIEKNTVERHGGQVILVKAIKGFSTTNILKKIRKHD